MMRSGVMVLCLLMASLVAAAEPDRAALERAGIKWKEPRGVITELQAQCDQFTDAEFRLIGQITTLKSLSISGKPLHDRHLAELAGLTELESLLINGSVLTDEGYRHFQAFPQLKSLSLFHPSRDVKEFTGKGLVFLQPLRQLTRLTFAGATAGDDALEAVGELTQLQEFREWHNHETAAGLAHLRKLPNLKAITIGQRLPRWNDPAPPSFTGETLKILADIKSLERISLQEARLSATDFQPLQQLPALKELKLKWIDISPNEIEQVQKLLPDVKIDFDPLTKEGEEMLSKKLKL